MMLLFFVLDKIREKNILKWVNKVEEHSKQRH